MYLILSLLVATVTLYSLSKLADYFLAKRPEIKWVLLASIGSALIALISYIGLTFILAGLDLSVADQSLTLTNRYPAVILIVCATIMLLLSSVAFKVVNQMCWPSAIATNFVSVAIISVVLAGSFAINDHGTVGKLETAKVKADPSKEITVEGKRVAKVR